jgi:hypothetical protein
MSSARHDLSEGTVKIVAQMLEKQGVVLKLAEKIIECSQRVAGQAAATGEHGTELQGYTYTPFPGVTRASLWETPDDSRAWAYLGSFECRIAFMFAELICYLGPPGKALVIRWNG